MTKARLQLEPPHTSFTASQQASTMLSRHTQSWHTHCQHTGTITWRSEYVCPGTRVSEAALSSGSSLCPLHWASTLSSLLSPLTTCRRTGGSNYLLNLQHSICLAPICLSLLPVPDPLLLCLLSRPPRTYIHTYPRPRPPLYMGS